MQTKIVGVDCDEGTPVPIPNTVVKLIYAENTWLVTAREDRSMPTQICRNSLWIPVFCFSQRSDRLCQMHKLILKRGQN